MEKIPVLHPDQTHPFPVKKDETEMGEEAKDILKPFLASSRPLCDPLQFSEIPGAEGDDLIGLPVIERANDNGAGRKQWHASISSGALSHPEKTIAASG